MREVAALIGQEVLHWHEPVDAKPNGLPDSRELWDVIWEHRDHLYSIAHLHPWEGVAHASLEDLTTFDAIESGLGRPLYWWVATLTELAVYKRGPGHIWQRVTWPKYAQHLTPWLDELRARGMKHDRDNRLARG